MTVLSSFDEVICDFARAKYLPRIKKLLVYACTHRWETDPERLAQHNLHTLIETLMQIAPTLDQLKAYLDQVTQSLSKPAEYLLIANAIVQSLRKIYVGTAAPTGLNSNPHLYWQVAQTLEQDPDHLRMRKLLILLCRNHWELDTNRLLAASLPDLVYELHQLTQTPDNLEAVFNSIVQNTSKPVQYGAIASRIISACQLLYSSESTSQTELRLSPPGTQTPPPTQVSPSHPFQQATSSTPISTAPQSADSAHYISHSSDAHPAPTTGINWATPVSNASAHPPSDSPSDPSVGQAVPESKTPNSQVGSDNIPAFTQAELFDLRLEIMKYTVPLLAKQLLFLTLYAPVEHNSDEEVVEIATDSETWAALKNRDLDDLIEGTLRQYPTLAMLEAGLQRSARLSQHRNRSVPVASAIARAVKTLTAKHHPDYLGDWPKPSADNLRHAEQTRQVISPTVSFEPGEAESPTGLDQLSSQPPQNRPNGIPTPLPNPRPPLPPSSSMTCSPLKPNPTVMNRNGHR